MLRELYTTALGMLSRQTRLELVANNLANLSTLGYKREALFQQALIEAQQNLSHVPGDPEAVDLPMASYTDFSHGALQHTGNPLDVALDGPGFFVVQDAMGQLFLTRQGRFSLQLDGTLRTPEGKLVLGIGSMPLRLPVIPESRWEQPQAAWHRAPLLEITAAGELRYRSVPVGTLWIVQAPLQALRRSDGVEFALAPGTQLQTLLPEEYRLLQGFVEGSNVNPVEELVQLVELQRQFELGQRVIRGNDSTLERSIEISRFV
ncbi:MAG: flagellar hook basal-body protein [Bacteroidota bacterium]|nr:flagellar hook basal-body protein [Bacteroidota bacterium]